jgi:WD40 repeat protein
MFEPLKRYLLGDDVFISYSRADGASYAAALANALAKNNLHCRLDQWSTEPGKEIPEALFRALRRSQLLVVVGTKQACVSTAMEKEIKAFLSTKRFIIVIDVCGRIASALWWKLLEGLPISVDKMPEIPLDQRNPSVTPSSEVLSRIENSVSFVRKDRRLRRASAIGVGLLLISILGASVGAIRAAASAVAVGKAEKAKQTANKLADEADHRRTQAELQERHAFAIAQAEDALTAQNPNKALLLIEDALRSESEHPEIPVSLQSRVIAAHSINQGTSQVYSYFSRVGSAQLSPDGRYIVAIGSTPSSFEETQLVIWSIDGKFQRSMKGYLGPLALSPDGKTLAVIRTELNKSAKSRPLRMYVEWYSYDLRMIRRTSLEPVSIDAKPEEISPLSFDSVQPSLPIDLRGQGRTDSHPTAFVYDIQEIEFTPNGKGLLLAGSVTINPRALIPRSYRAYVDVVKFAVTSIIDMKNDLTLKTDTNRETIRSLGSSGFASFASDKELRIIEIAAVRDETIGQHSTEIRDIGASPSGNRVAAVGVDNKVSIFEKLNGAWQKRAVDLPGERGCSRVLFVDENHIVAAREDFSLTLAEIGDDTSRPRYLVDTSVGRLENPRFVTLNGPSAQIKTLVVSPDRQWLVAAGDDRVTYAWNLRVNDRRAFQGNDRGVTSIGFSADSNWMTTGGLDGTVRLWELTGRMRRTVPAELDRNDVQFYLSDTLTERGEILDEGWTRESLRKALGFVKTIQVSHDGKYFLTQTYNHKISLWNSDLTLLHSFDYETLAGAAISLDSKWVMIARNKSWRGTGEILVQQGIDLYNIATRKKISVDGDIEPHEGLFSPSGEWAEIRNAKLFLHKIDQGIDSRKLAQGAFSPDGKWFARPGPKNIEIWSIENPSRNAVAVPLSGPRLESEDDEPGDFSGKDIWMQFSPDSHNLGVSVRSHGESALDVITLSTQARFILRGRGIHGPYVFSPDSNWLAGTGGGVELLLWSINKTEPKVLGQHAELVNSIAFSPNSKWVATGSEDNTSRVWSIEGSAVYEMRQLVPTKSIAFIYNGQALLQSVGNGIQVLFSPSAPVEDILRHQVARVSP